MTSSVLARFFSELAFSPDEFQREALRHVEAGRSVVVTAPTGAGKTLVADGSIAITISNGQRAFYTTPIKALSNQKFNDLTAVHGSHNVGLLTGDNVINGDASIVVMTTEVLRNMIYEGSPALDDLGLVILDEVHYLADRHRGSVWEEIIIHLSKQIVLVCLSATVANPEEFTAWVRERRGECALVVETDRPVPLTSMYMWRDRHRDGSVAMLPIFGKNGRPNGAIRKMLASGRSRERRLSTPRRVPVVQYLDTCGLLPCIYFVFSRKGCDQTAQEVGNAGLKLTTPEEMLEIRSIVERRVGHLSSSDLAVLGYGRWLATLQQGAAAHHAGLIPAFKETVEELFLAGLVKFVAATETLALGINMPARTVVLDSLSKFDGEGHEILKSSEYTQLTGRAGRRGIDSEGTAVVLFSTYLPFDRVSAVAARGANPLESSFAPTYNMAVNLIARYEKKEALDLLSASFANFSVTHRVDRLQENLDSRREDAETFRSAAECEQGDIFEITDQNVRGLEPSADIQQLKPGVVLRVGDELLVLIGRSWGGEKPRLSFTDVAGERVTMRVRDVPRLAEIVGKLTLPSPVRPQDAVFRRGVGSMLEAFVPSTEPKPVFPQGGSRGVLGCPDVEKHMHWAERARRAERDIRRLERRVQRSHTSDVADEFSRIRGVLEATGYTRGWELTESGESLRRIYSELDLLLAETLRVGVFDTLTPPEFGALASIFTYQHRGREDSSVPEARSAREPIERIAEIAASIGEREQREGRETTRAVDTGLVDSMHAWGSGLDLADIFETDDLRAGDFVRSSRQVIDLLRQIRDSFPQYRMIATEVLSKIDRGIVAVEGS